jgi:hypothetical protein
MNKLKEIREKWFPPKYSYKVEGSGTPDCYPKEIIFNDTEFSKTQDQIQKETYLLGLEEIDDFISNVPIEMAVLGMDLKDAIKDKIQELRNEIEKNGGD